MSKFKITFFECFKVGSSGGVAFSSSLSSPLVGGAVLGGPTFPSFFGRCYLRLLHGVAFSPLLLSGAALPSSLLLLGGGLHLLNPF